MLGQGDVVASDILQVPSTKDFQFEFKPTLAMVPEASVIVFYITSDGEIISDSTKIEFSNELNNFVSFQPIYDQIDFSLKTFLDRC